MSKQEWKIGDCVELMKQLPDESIDLVVTSPPYDNLRDYGGFVFDFEATAKELYRIVKNGGVVVWVVGDATIKGSETGTSFRQALQFMDIGFNLHDTMIYKKNGTGACGSNLCYWQEFEFMFVLSKNKPKTVNRLDNGKRRTAGGKKLGRLTTDGKQKVERRSVSKDKKQIRGNVWEYNIGFAAGEKRNEHPAVFPESLAKDHILSWSNEEDLVFDPFLGSGTTLKMCQVLNRNGIGFECNNDYESIIKERLHMNERKLDQWF